MKTVQLMYEKCNSTCVLSASARNSFFGIKSLYSNYLISTEFQFFIYIYQVSAFVLTISLLEEKVEFLLELELLLSTSYCDYESFARVIV